MNNDTYGVIDFTNGRVDSNDGFKMIFDSGIDFVLDGGDVIVSGEHNTVVSLFNRLLKLANSPLHVEKLCNTVNYISL